MSVIIFIIGLLMFVGLVVVHELGHALVARRKGVEVEEFGIGFPPRIFGKKLKSGTLFSFNWLPLGGFVRLKGEHDAATGVGTYGGANLWAKTQILLAGVIVNWLVAATIFTILALIGLPQVLPDQFTVPSDTVYSQRDVFAGTVVKDSPANKAGIKNGDQIITLAGRVVTSGERLVQLTSSHAGQKVSITIKRGTQTHIIDVVLNKTHSSTQGYAGIQPVEQISRRSTWSAPIVGVGITVQFTKETFKGLGQTIGYLFQRNFQAAGKNVAGPVGVITILQQSSKVGFIPVLFLIGIISLTLAVMNVLPIPALDGGRLFVTVLFRVLRKRLTKEREESIQAVGFLTLMGLVVLITIVDVGRAFGK